MSSITFVDYQTIIPASWLNDVNNMVYNGVVPATTLSPTNLSVSTNASIANITNNVVFTSTGAITLPNGTTAQEPGTPSAGMIRFNSTKTQFEGYNGSAWSSFGIVGGSNAQVQYNSSGALAGSANFTFNGTTVTMANDASIHGLTVGLGGGSVSTNTAVGVSSLQATTSGANSTALGYQSGYNNTTGRITAIGSKALYANTSGDLNTAIGFQSQLATTTGYDNVSVGVNSLSTNTTGNYNVAVGDNSLNSNTTGGNNTAVGYQAGYTLNTSGGNFNALFGYQAGYGLTTGISNTLIGSSSTYPGYGAGYLITSGSYNTVLGGYSGNQGGLDIRTSSNYIVLSDGAGNPAAYRSGSTNGWYFGNGGTSSTYDGVINLNGAASTGRGAALVGLSNGSSAWAAGSYSYVVSGTSSFFAVSNTSGGVYLNGSSATSWTAVSDETRKVIIEDITDGLNKVSTLRAIIGRLKTDDNTIRRPYLIAQDVQKVLPEAVSQSEDKEGPVLGLSYTEVIPLLVASIKELNNLVTAQATEIAALKAKVGV